MLNYFSISGLCIAFINLALAILITISGKKLIHRIWAYVNYSISLWGLGIFISGSTVAYDRAYLGWRIFTIGITLIAVLYYHVIHLFCKLKSRRFLNFSYIQGAFFICLTIFTQVMFSGELKFSFSQFYYFKAGLVYNSYLGIWTLIVGKSFYELFKYIKESTGIVRIQSKYLFVAMMFGFGSGLTTAPAAWGFDVYPYGQIFVCVYGMLASYAIFKYQLLDIRVAVTRVGVFIAVYTLVLGIPFAMAFGLQELLIKFAGEKWWILPLIASTILATVGPFIYLYIQKKAENKILEEQHRYQSTLRQASYGMGRIKDLKRLLNLIVHIVTRTVSIEQSIVYINDTKTKQYVLGAFRSRTVRSKPKDSIQTNSPIVKGLCETKNPIVYDEVKYKTQDYGNRELAELEIALREINAAVVVPNFIDDKLIAFIVLGRKISGDLYGDEDLTVFSILANQAALAIENAQFYDDMKKTHAQLIRAEKMATIGTMADGLSHQINNRLHALGFIAGDLLDTIKLRKKNGIPEDMKELFVDVEHALSRIQDNVAQGGDVVQGLLKYTRKGEEGFTSVDLDKLLDASVEMTQFKIKHGEMTIIREFGGDVPKIKGNFTQLQEVFFNVIDNAYDAMMQRKAELKEAGFEPTLRIAASASNGHIEIVIADNGIGVKDEDKEKLFTPFFTTKLSSKKGTGLGLYVIQRIIEENHGGKVSYASKYKSGTQTKIRLKIYKETDD